MKEKTNPLFKSLYSGDIGKKEFLQKYFKGKTLNDKHVLDMIQRGIANKDSSIIEEAITLIYTDAFPYSSFTLKLCELLQMHWHTKHEDIAMLLKDIADPASVECIYEATELQFDYLDYDDTYQFARKCIKALSVIGNENAINKLNILSKSKVQKISDYAKKELHYKGLQ